MVRPSTKSRVLAATLVALFATLVPLIGCGGRAGAGIILAGSTSVQPFAEILAEDYMKLHQDVNIDVQGGGSASGILAAQTGTADIGMSSRALEGDELKLWWVEIARDGIAMIVNPENPVANLTSEQVRGIYAGTITNWSAVGSPVGAIHVVAREDGSGTRASFEELVMGSDSITPKAIIQDSNGAVRQVVADDPGAIGFISLGLVDSSVKGVDLGGVAPTRDNVVNGSYRFSRPFLFVARSEPTGGVMDFVDYVLSDAGKQILGTEGLVTTGGSGQ